MDQQLLQGTWTATSGSLGGRSGDTQAKIRWSVTGDKIVFDLNGRWNAKFTLDPGRWPKRIDLVATSADGKSTERFRGVYELRGDELYVCLASGDEPRPSNLCSSPDTKEVSLVLRRERP